jgi:DNA-binding LacI/PurR family transcriptional regulator
MAGSVRTMADLARVAGVSVGTVSRALANNDLVKPATRRRIQSLAEQHGFRVNQMASRLRTRRTGMIGLVVPLGHERRQHISDPFFMTLIGHLADALTESGFDLLLSRVIPRDDDWLERIVESGMLDGVLLLGQSDQAARIDRVAADYLPLVAWGTYRPDQVHCSVGTDNFAGGRLAARHLVRRGARRIAFFGDVAAAEMAERFAGCETEVAQQPQASVVLRPTSLSIDAMEEDVGEHLDALGEELDGIVAASDVIAMTTLRVLHDRRIAVPERIAVTGFDDLPLATQTVPRLTTIRQDIAGGAQAMVSCLTRRMGGEATASVIMPPQLVLRDSA